MNCIILNLFTKTIRSVQFNLHYVSRWVQVCYEESLNHSLNGGGGALAQKATHSMNDYSIQQLNKCSFTATSQMLLARAILNQLLYKT